MPADRPALLPPRGSRNPGAAVLAWGAASSPLRRPVRSERAVGRLTAWTDRAKRRTNRAKPTAETCDRCRQIHAISYEMRSRGQTARNRRQNRDARVQTQAVSQGCCAVSRAAADADRLPDTRSRTDRASSRARRSDRNGALMRIHGRSANRAIRAIPAIAHMPPLQLDKTVQPGSSGRARRPGTGASSPVRPHARGQATGVTRRISSPWPGRVSEAIAPTIAMPAPASMAR